MRDCRPVVTNSLFPRFHIYSKLRFRPPARSLTGHPDLCYLPTVLGSLDIFSVKSAPFPIMELPRRIQVDKYSPAEKAIADAIDAVEKLGADIRLTQAVILLGEAKEQVADYIDGIKR